MPGGPAAALHGIPSDTLPDLGRFHLDLVAVSLEERWENVNTDMYTWLFVLADGGDELVASAEVGDDGGTIKTGRVSVERGAEDAFGYVQWHTLFTIQDLLDLTSPRYGDFGDVNPLFYGPSGATNFTGISDHYHIYFSGYHYIACSLTWRENPDDLSETPLNVGAVLIKFTVDEDGFPTIVGAELVFAPADSDDYYDYGTTRVRPKQPTNDLFLHADSITVPILGEIPLLAVGIHHTLEGPITGLDGRAVDQGHTIYRHFVSLMKDVEVTFYGDCLAHTNGAGAFTVENTGRLSPFTGLPSTSPARVVLAPETFDPVKEGKLVALVSDEDWTLTEAVTDPSESSRYDFMEASGYNLAMPMLIRVNPFVDALVFRRRDVSLSAEDGDYGTIVLQIRDRSGTLMLPELELTDEGNRPHLLASDGLLCVTWDQADGIYLKVYEIEALTDPRRPEHEVPPHVDLGVP